jgi:hypothetical protein
MNDGISWTKDRNWSRQAKSVMQSTRPEPEPAGVALHGKEWSRGRKPPKLKKLRQGELIQEISISSNQKELRKLGDNGGGVL